MTAEPADLKGRLDQAQRDHGPLQERVTELETALEQAIADKRFADADQHQADLGPARDAAALAAATVRALTEAQTAIDAKVAEERAAIDLERRREHLRTQAAAAVTGEAAALEELHRLVDAVHVGLDAVRQNIAAALHAQSSVGDQRQQLQDLQVALGEWAPARVVAPNDMTILIERDPAIRAIWTRRA